MDIISGVARPVNLMALQPESGKTLFALSSIQWGALNDATRNRDRYKKYKVSMYGNWLFKYITVYDRNLLLDSSCLGSFV